MKDKKREQLLDEAWRTAFNSVTYEVIGNDSHSETLITEATHRIRNIDKEDWFPIARNILRTNSYISADNLAEEAATLFINRKMDTKGLRVTFGSDW